VIRRRKPLSRNSKPIKRSPIARSSKPIPKRRPGKARRGPADIPVDEWRSPEYRRWVAETGKCPACEVELERLGIAPGAVAAGRLKAPRHLRAGVQAGYCDPAHTENGGMRMKGRDSSCCSLCRGFDLPNHHREYDAGRAAFERKYGLDMAREAAARWYLWRLLFGSDLAQRPTRELPYGRYGADNADDTTV
jgi:hypothetical protein